MKQIGRLLINCLMGLWALGSVPLFAQTSFVYTNDNVGGANTVSGFSVAPSGSLTLLPGSPFSTGGRGNGGSFFSTPRIVASSIGGFLYVANGASNNVSVFSINPSSGSLTPVSGSPFATATTGGGDLALAVTPDNKFLFAGDSLTDEITVFSIAVNGALSIVTGSPYLVPGAAAGASIDGMNVSPDGKFLALTLPGNENEIAMYSIGAEGTLTMVSGSPFSPSGAAAGVEFSCSASMLFVSDFNGNTDTQVEVDSVAPTGALSPVSGSPFIFTSQGINSNVGILSPNGLDYYVSNQYSGQITGLSVASNGGLTPLGSSPFATGFASGCPASGCPMGMAINQAGTLLFLASGSPSVAVLSVANGGALTPVTGSPFTSGLSTSNARSLAIWPATVCPQSSFVYTNDNIVGANTVSGFSVAPTGSLTLLPGSPFSTGGTGLPANTSPFFATPRIVASPIGEFVYAANGASNDVSVFLIDPSSGHLTSVSGSPFATASTGGGDLALAVTPDNKFLFAGDSLADEITVFSIGAGGALSIVAGSPYIVPTATGGGTINAMNVSSDGKFLALTVPGGTNAVDMYGIGANGTLTAVSGSPFSPSGGAAGLEFSCPASTLFLSDANGNIDTEVEVDSVAPTGALSPVSGSPFIFTNQGINSNVGILSPNGLDYYVSNQYSGQITGLSVASNGGLTPLGGSPFATGFASGCPFPGACATGMAINQAGTLLFLASESPELAVLNVANGGTLTPATGSPFTSGVSTSNAQSLAIWPATNCPPVVNLSPPSLAFGNQLLDTTSDPLSATLTNTSPNSTLTITSITASGDFSQTNTCGTAVSVGDNCTINVTFTPTALGNRTGSVTLTDSASGSPQTLNLSGTGTGPVVSLSAPLTFSAQLVGTTSSSQTVTLTNTGNSSLTFTAITVTGPFAIATSGNTCSTSNPVAAAGTCTVAITFTPTTGGTVAYSLSFSDNAAGSPQTIALSGTGQDFTLAAATGSSTSATVAPGQTATYTLSVGGEGGLSGSVTFTVTGAPSEATCTASPSPAALGTNVTVTCTTTAPSADTPRSRPLPPVPPLSPGLRGLLMLALILAAMAWAIMRRNQAGVSRWKATMLPLAAGLLLTLALAGCHSGSTTTTTSNPGTPAGTSTLTLTGTTGSGASALSHSLTLTLTVS